MNDDEPSLRDLYGWLLAGPFLKGRTERIIWWAVLRKYWVSVLWLTFIGNMLWMFVFKFIGAQLQHHGFYWWAWALGY